MRKKAEEKAREDEIRKIHERKMSEEESDEELQVKNRAIREKQDRKASKTDTHKYYKSFSKDPKDFRQLYTSPQREYSSTEEDEPSSDDFPSPRSPVKKNNDTKILLKIIKKMQKKIKYLEKLNKLRSRNSRY